MRCYAMPGPAIHRGHAVVGDICYASTDRHEVDICSRMSDAHFGVLLSAAQAR